MQGNTNAFGSAGGLGDSGYQKLTDGALKINFNGNTPQTVKVGTVEDWTNSGVLTFCGGISDLAVANNNLDIVSDNTEIGSIRLSHTTDENTCNSVYLTNNGISLGEEVIEINSQTGIATLQINENSVATWQNLISTANGDNSNYIKAVSSTAQDLESVINSKVEQGEYIPESETDMITKAKDHYLFTNSGSVLAKISSFSAEFEGQALNFTSFRVNKDNYLVGLMLADTNAAEPQVILSAQNFSNAEQGSVGSSISLSPQDTIGFSITHAIEGKFCGISSWFDQQQNILGIHISGDFLRVPQVTDDSDYSMQAATVGYVRSKISSIDFSSYQTTANLVTSITAQSTDSQYPSAKAVYDLLNALTAKIATLEAKVTELESQVSNTEAELNDINSGE